MSLLDQLAIKSTAKPAEKKPAPEAKKAEASKPKSSGSPPPAGDPPEKPATLPREIMIDKPGFYPEITSRQYFAEPCPEPALTNSGIKTLMGKTPADFAYEHPAITPDSPEAASTAAQRLGDVSHQLSLDKGRGYAIGEYSAWQSGDAKAFKAAAESAGLTPVKRAEYDKAAIMAEIMKVKIRHALKLIGAAGGLIEPEGGWPYQTEAVAAWQEDTPSGPIWCRMMMDVWCEPLWTVIDPKFSKQLHGDILARQMANMGWDQQAAFYGRGIENLIPAARGKVTFVNILVSPDAPHVSRIVKIEEAWRYSSQLDIEAATKTFAAHLKAGVWPAYPDGIETLSAPEWLIKQRMGKHEFGDDPWFGGDSNE